jgi:hypothetical protein
MVMAVGYLLMLLWLKAHGGYKKIVLTETAAVQGAGAGGGH